MQNSRLMIIVALTAGIMATVLAFAYINSAKAALEKEEPEQLISILFVANDLEANSVLDADMDLRVGTVGADTVEGLARSAVKAEERQSVHGMRINTPLPAGVPLLYQHLTKITDFDLPPGTRAMSIDVDSASLMGGLLIPGDRVDVIVSYRMPPKQNDLAELDPQDPGMAGMAMGAIMNQVMSQASGVPSEWVAEVVLSGIRVIAVGQLLAASRQAQMFGMTDLGGGGSTVTLEVTPEQALTLIRATAGGGNPLTLLLWPKETAGEAEANALSEG